MIRAGRFLRSFYRKEHPGLEEREVQVELEGGAVPATLLRPDRRGELPGWVVLHGITGPGRHHPVLLRFCRALAGSRATVLIPEVTPWKELRIDPMVADRTIAGATRFLAGQAGVAPGGVGVVGFSFGATQALVTAARPELRDVLRSVVGFGGYCDLGRTLRFMMLGEHDWRGERYGAEPDPYGRWIVAGNYLTAVPGMERMEAVAEAARDLARESARRWVYAGDPSYDPYKAELRDRLDPSERELWDLIAPPTGRAAADAETRELADRLIAAALARHPQLDATRVFPTIDRRVVLAHGRDDRLVPFTESLRLREHLTAADVSVTVTRLFAHSRGAEGLRLREYPGEMIRYFRLLDRALK